VSLCIHQQHLATLSPTLPSRQSSLFSLRHVQTVLLRRRDARRRVLLLHFCRSGFFFVCKVEDRERESGDGEREINYKWATDEEEKQKEKEQLSLPISNRYKKEKQ